MTKEEIKKMVLVYCEKCTKYEDMTSKPIKRKHLIEFAMLVKEQAENEAWEAAMEESFQRYKHEAMQLPYEHKSIEDWRKEKQ